MAAYVKLTNFLSKDSLLTGNPDKVVTGSELDAEFNAIALSSSQNITAITDSTTAAAASATAAAASATSAATSATTATTQATNAAASATTASTQATNASNSATSASSSASTATTQATNAAASATSAAASAVSAAASATALTGTSTTSLTPSLAEKIVTTQASKEFAAGTFVEMVSASDPTIWMFGPVTSYTGTTLTFTPTAIGTASAKADWTVYGRVGARGATGATGATGAGLTDQATGFTATGGTIPKTLTVDVDVTASLLAQTAASQAEMEAGTQAALRTMSPLRVAQAIAALATTTITWTIITANPSPAVAGTSYMCNTTAGAFTVTLPAAPAANAIVRIADYAGTFATNNLTIGRNALKIMGLAEDMVIGTNNVSITLTYIDVTQGWRVS